MPVRSDTSRVAVAPSILSADFGRLAEEVAAVDAAGCDIVHVDVMDGHFVPNLTIGPPVVKAIRAATETPLDVHLMIAHPERSLTAYVAAGARSISVHAEACVHLHRVVHQIRDAGAKASVALNPHTPLDVVDYLLEDLDMVLLMSVDPGFGGQAFIPQVLGKIATLAERVAARGLQVDIEVDGGVKVANSKALADAGATVLVAGSAIFGASDYRSVIENIRREAAG